MLGEFHYRLRHAVTGNRPGSHPASTLGAGHRFAGHARLFDIPDPRRIDLRASLRDVRREWLVRTHLQRAAIPVYAVVDVSASMLFGARLPKLVRAADFVGSMGDSAYRAGDPAGLIAFEASDADPIDMPARHHRGIGSLMADHLRALAGREPGPGPAPGRESRVGLQQAIERLTDQAALVFLVSDFHWPLERLGPALDALSSASVVPMVVWDRAEIEPPGASGLLNVVDAETRAVRTLMVGGSLRERWLERVGRRRRVLDALFAARELRPFHLIDRFDPMALSRYFMEGPV